jgi:hypothetical protein
VWRPARRHNQGGRTRGPQRSTPPPDQRHSYPLLSPPPLCTMRRPSTPGATYPVRGRRSARPLVKGRQEAGGIPVRPSSRARNTDPTPHLHGRAGSRALRVRRTLAGATRTRPGPTRGPLGLSGTAS